MVSSVIPMSPYITIFIEVSIALAFIISEQ